MNIHRQAPTPFVGDHFEVVPEPGSTKLVMYFTATGAAPRVFNFWRPGNAVKTHRIFVNNARAWYQQGVPGLGSSVDETVETVRRWADYLGASEIYTVGGSMGGYGAALFGCLLDARVLAFSFETELDLEGSRSRKLMTPGTAITHRDLGPLMERSRKPIFAMISERDAVDVFSLERVRRFPMVKVKTIKGVLHGPQNYLHKRDRLVPLLEAFVDNFDDMPEMPEDGDLFTKDGFPEAFFRTHQHHAAKRWDAAVETGKDALLLMPMSEQCNWLVGESLVALKRYAEAYPYLCTARHCGGTSAEFYYSIANCIRALGDYKEAIKHHKQTLAYWPEHAKSYYGIGLSYQMIGDRHNAGVCFRRAARLMPTNPAFKTKAEKYPASQVAPAPDEG